MTRGDRLFTRDLVDGLNGFTDRPWAEIANGKQITDRWLARRLNPFEIRSRTLRIGEMVAKGYAKEDFEEVFRRYISRAEVEALRADLRAEERGGQKAEDARQGPEAGGGAEDEAAAA